MKGNTIETSLDGNQKRKDWPEAFQEMAKNGDDELLIPAIFEDEEFTDWTWE